MFGISFSEMLLVGIVALLVFGPEKLPEVVRWIGRVSGQLRKTSEHVRREFYSAVYQPAENEIASAKGELQRLKTEYLNNTRLDPACPDTIQKRAETLKSSQEALLPSAVEPSASSTPTKIVPVVDIAIPHTPSADSTPNAPEHSPTEEKSR